MDSDGHVCRIEPGELDELVPLRLPQADNAGGAAKRLDEQAASGPSRTAQDRVEAEVVDEHGRPAVGRARKRDQVRKRREDDVDVTQLQGERKLAQVPADTVRQEPAASIERGLASFRHDSERREVVQSEKMRVGRGSRIALRDQVAAGVRIDVRDARGFHLGHDCSR